MSLLTYTTYAEVRSVLGVSSTELTDETLAQSIYAMQATLGLEDIHADIPANFATVSALPSKTAQQQRFLDLVKLYVPYQTAKTLLVSLPLFAVKQLSDGRAEFQRQAEVFADLKDGIDSAVMSLKYRLAATFTALYPSTPATTSTTTVLQVISTGLAVDPVTGI